MQWNWTPRINTGKSVRIPRPLSVSRELTVLCQYTEFQNQSVKINTEDKHSYTCMYTSFFKRESRTNSTLPINRISKAISENKHKELRLRLYKRRPCSTYILNSINWRECSVKWSARYLSHMNHVNVSPTDGNGPTQGQRKTLTRVGIEPTTFGLDSRLDLRRSTDWATRSDGSRSSDKI